jgi:hypothetical protein
MLRDMFHVSRPAIDSNPGHDSLVMPLLLRGKFVANIGQIGAKEA